MNKFVVIANERFEPGLIAFLNSYKLTGNKTPIVIIDTGLKNEYPHETIKRDPNMNYKKAAWMTDCSPYQQLQLGNINADKIIYLEVDMLLLNNIDHLFNHITATNIIAVMDDAALSVMNHNQHIDSAGRYFTEGSHLRSLYFRNKGYNGGLIGGTIEFYRQLEERFYSYLEPFESQYRLLAQSLLNQYFIEEHIFVKDIGLQYNFSGINEYYATHELYKINFNNNTYHVKFNDFAISILHFTGKEKPFLVPDKNVMTPVWEYYYNGGELV